MFQLHSDFEGDGNMDISSDPFWLIFNHGMSEEDFETMAIPRFGGASAIPEPGTGMALLLGAIAAAAYRRRTA